MHRTTWNRTVAAIGIVAAVAAGDSRVRGAAPIGVFDDQGDVGVPSTLGAGAAVYDAATKTYSVAGGGENMWARADHFRYVWKKMSGDVSLSATIQFTATQPARHRTSTARRVSCFARRSMPIRCTSMPPRTATA